MFLDGCGRQHLEVRRLFWARSGRGRLAATSGEKRPDASGGDDRCCLGQHNESFHAGDEKLFCPPAGGRKRFAVLDRNISLRGTPFRVLFRRIRFVGRDASYYFPARRDQRTVFSGSELFVGKAIGLQ